MQPRHTRIMALILIAITAIVGASLYVERHAIVKSVIKLPPEEKIVIGWRADFDCSAANGAVGAPQGWEFKNKPGTRPAEFSIRPSGSKDACMLHMEADSSSASIITALDGLDLKKTPIMRWRWRVTKLPDNADGRVRSKDDQAISIYVGTGSIFNNKSVSYRWDTDTPMGSEGRASYVLGAVKTKWYTLRNRDDAKNGEWITEERNVAKDFMDAWGFYPEKLYISISSNSQYTGSRAAADLEWIEFASRKMNK